MKLALALLTKDHPELTRRSIEPLVQPGKYDLFIVDGSRTDEGLAFACLQERNEHIVRVCHDIRGGADAAIVYALTVLLEATENNEWGRHRLKYTHIGLIEQDVLLPPDWLAPTLALFERGQAEGLEVGAVSARCYEDRILCQRDGYALCHNLGAGHIIFTREAARLILDNYRTAWSLENRTTFSQLSGIDIARWWAFRGNEINLTADWHFNTILARHGLASLALTPSLATMLDQDIAEQGLKYADGHAELLRNDKAFEQFADTTTMIRSNRITLDPGPIQASQGGYIIFPHQIAGIGGKYEGDWRMRWSQGLGPFAWAAPTTKPDSLGNNLYVSLLGTVEILVSGGVNGGQVVVEDYYSGYQCSPNLLPEGEHRQVLSLPVPGGCTYRTVRLTCLSPGVTFYGIRTQYPQPWHTGYRFDYSMLPPVRAADTELPDVS